MTRQVRTVNDADQVILARPTQDGDGVNIHRIAGGHLNALLDPFLLIDEIRSDDASDYVGGFPEHPHRGFQTLTYMLEGGFKHRDSIGNEGSVRDGGLQWLSAARGVLHSEMPLPRNGRLHGYQFWINLPAQYKMESPAYRDIQAEEIPYLRDAQGTVYRQLLGGIELDDNTRLEAALNLPRNKVAMTDVALSASGQARLRIPAGFVMQVLVVSGYWGGYGEKHLLHFAAMGEESVLQIDIAEAAKLIVFGGHPLKEPIAQYGPFVMNTREEIEQAMRDYRDGVLSP
ncbi:MAG: pirin family protein [Oleiphilaceae bacterium]|nr:pirin family protein [Oleiphilaceae bacterium]